MTVSTTSRLQIAAGVARDLHACEPAIAAEYVADLEDHAVEAFRVAWAAKTEADRLMRLAYAKRAEFIAARNAAKEA